MKLIRQFTIILAFSLAGEALHALLPLPVPASISRIARLFAALMLHLLRVEDIRAASGFLIEIMPALFIPAGVGLMAAFGVLRPMLVPIAVIMAVSTVVVMGVSGRVTQGVIRRERRGEGEPHA